LGRAFTAQVRDYDAANSVAEAVENGKSVYVKLGGLVYKIPAERAGDAQAFLADIKARLVSTERTTRGKDSKSKARPYGALIGLTTGVGGIVVDLDDLSFSDKEVTDELGAWTEHEEEARDLSEYFARSAEQFLGVDVDPEDIRQAWEDKVNDEGEFYEE
jgi:hypothetical protein